MENKKSVYLDSTILSFYNDERPELRNFIDATKRWWDEERINYELFSSQATVAEIENGDHPNKEKILKLIPLVEILEIDIEIDNIAKVYIENFVMPREVAGDAVHLAYASLYKIDYLLTWNCKHLANANKKQHILIVNTKMNLFTPEIITPLELVEED